MNNLYDALNHIQKAISLLGEDLVTLTRSSIDSLPAVALSEELLKLVPLHAIRGGFLTVITTDVLNGIGVLAGFKCLLVKCWEFGRVLGAGGRKTPWPADAGSGGERASMAGDRWVWSKRSRRMAHCAVGLC